MLRRCVIQVQEVRASCSRPNNARESFTYCSLPGEELYFKQATSR
jgi:hypothetical protein